MRNHPVPSVLAGVLIAAAIAGLLGVAFATYVSNSVNPQDPNLTVEAWRAAYLRSVAWSVLVVAICSAIWLLVAHRGRGLDTKSGQWYALWCASMFISALLAWLIPPAVREGPLEPMLVNAGIAFLGYWASTMFMTPDHYRLTPLLARVIWGRA